MARYIVNTQAREGDHEVHNADAHCAHMPAPKNQEHLGEFTSCRPAVAKAKQKYPTADGCFHCCNSCHSR